MRNIEYLWKIFAGLIFLLWSGLAWGEDFSALRANIINPDTAEHDESLGPRMLVEFNLDGILRADNIGYAELVMPVSLRALSEDSVVRFDAFLAGRTWDENASWREPWVNPGGDVDSQFIASYAVKTGRADTLHIDVTQMVRAWSDGSRANIGLIILPRHPDQVRYGPLPFRPRDIRARMVLRVYSASMED
jgi:hypothetical protein